MDWTTTAAPRVPTSPFMRSISGVRSFSTHGRLSPLTLGPRSPAPGFRRGCHNRGLGLGQHHDRNRHGCRCRGGRGVALFAESRADKRIAAERAHSDEQLREERARGDVRLAEERRLFQEREQFAEAYAVQVTLIRSYSHGGGEDEAQRLIAAIVNHSGQTITPIEVRFSPDGSSVIPAHKQERLAVDLNLPSDTRLASRFVASAEARTFSDRLTAWDTGMTAETDPIGVQRLTDPRVIVRWTDRWGTRWEYKRGDVGMVDDSAQWAT